MSDHQSGRMILLCSSGPLTVLIQRAHIAKIFETPDGNLDEKNLGLKIPSCPDTRHRILSLCAQTASTLRLASRTETLIMVISPSTAILLGPF